MALTIFFDLSRIAAMGAIFFSVMDIAIHRGVLWCLCQKVDAKAWMLITVIVLDVAVLAAFLVAKAQTDMLVIWSALLGLIVVFAGERYSIRRSRDGQSVG